MNVFADNIFIIFIYLLEWMLRMQALSVLLLLWWNDLHCLEEL